MYHRNCTSSLIALASLVRRIVRDRAGNTLPLIAAAMIPLLALVGGGVDMGRSYLAQTRLQQACDSGTLAARKKLGTNTAPAGTPPADVKTVGDNFFNQNFRTGSYGTTNRSFTMTLEADYAISGAAHIDVPTTIMGVFGKKMVNIDVTCQAKLNFSNADIMFVLDTTGSMATTNLGDTDTRIDVLKKVVHDFHAQIESSKGPTTRVRYGFVPYSTNVNVGSLLKDDWVVKDWAYQSREDFGTAPGELADYTYNDNFTKISGNNPTSTAGGYLAKYHSAENESGSAYWSCDTAPPASTGNTVYTLISTTTEPYPGPPAGIKTIKHFSAFTTGVYYWIEQVGPACVVKKTTYNSYTEEFDQITIPYTKTILKYRYANISRDVSKWRSESNGCIEERDTYEINDYANVDLSRALDLDLDLVPTAGNKKTQWRPQYPNVIYERSQYSDGSGSFTPADVVTTEPWFLQPGWIPSMIACPAPARKLGEMDSAQIDSYLATITAGGTTYHDIGMIWGGRLLSPLGLFSTDNADVAGTVTNRNLIFLTDGQTEPYDIAYGAYGVEPLDQRRWNPTSAMTLPDTVDKRFGVACNEVKKRNINVWVIGFGTTLNPTMLECAGPGHFFEAKNSSALQDVFAKIASQLGDLRVSK